MRAQTHDDEPGESRDEGRSGREGHTVTRESRRAGSHGETTGQESHGQDNQRREPHDPGERPSPTRRQGCTYQNPTSQVPTTTATANGHHAADTDAARHRFERRGPRSGHGPQRGSGPRRAPIFRRPGDALLSKSRRRDSARFCLHGAPFVVFVDRAPPGLVQNTRSIEWSESALCGKRRSTYSIVCSSWARWQPGPVTHMRNVQVMLVVLGLTRTGIPDSTSSHMKHVLGGS